MSEASRPRAMARAVAGAWRRKIRRESGGFAHRLPEAATLASSSLPRGAPLVLVVALALSACAPRIAREVAPAPVFLDATPLLGEDVVVHGVLRWQDQSRELVPADATGALRLPRPCLPILIPLGEQALADAATRLNGKRVRVEGVIVDAVPRGLVTTKACQPVGLRVSGLDADK